VTNIPAMLAEVKVAITPEIKAEKATLATRPALPGASVESTPIWIPTEEILPKPQTAYVAMSWERGERANWYSSDVKLAN
jgi:hypothetical protein